MWVRWESERIKFLIVFFDCFFDSLVDDIIDEGNVYGMVD
jgi:hypothetical protein